MFGNLCVEMGKIHIPNWKDIPVKSVSFMLWKVLQKTVQNLHSKVRAVGSDLVAISSILPHFYVLMY